MAMGRGGGLCCGCILNPIERVKEPKCTGFQVCVGVVFKMGRKTLKTEPCPTSLETMRRPSWPSTMALTVASPRPNPSVTSEPFPLLKESRRIRLSGA